MIARQSWAASFWKALISRLPCKSRFARTSKLQLPTMWRGSARVRWRSMIRATGAVSDASYLSETMIDWVACRGWRRRCTAL